MSYREEPGDLTQQMSPTTAMWPGWPLPSTLQSTLVHMSCISWTLQSDRLCQWFDPLTPKVILFGSRARKDNGDRSDIDLAIYSEASISEFIEDIENNTTTLLEFDFSDMKSVSDELFINQVNKEGIIIYEKYWF